MMIVKDDKCYAAGKVPILKISSVRNLGNYQLVVSFNNGDTNLFDGRQLLNEGEVFAPLADESVFNDYTLDYETLTWRNGEIDIAPEYVYAKSSAYVKVA